MIKPLSLESHNFLRVHEPCHKEAWLDMLKGYIKDIEKEIQEIEKEYEE
jgi:hypothetical protein